MVNLELVKMILDKLGKPHSLISFVPDRLGHDRRYAIDSSFAQRELNWKPQRSFKVRARCNHSGGTSTIHPGGSLCLNVPGDIEPQPRT